MKSSNTKVQPKTDFKIDIFSTFEFKKITEHLARKTISKSRAKK